jgi:Leucine-rich repeat (LRR) protein
MPENHGETLSGGEKAAIKDLEKLYPEDQSLIRFDIKNGHLTRLWISAVDDFNQEITIHDLPPSIGNLKWLEKLEIVDNELWELPESIGGLEALQVLDLSDNPLTELPESVGNLTSLRELYLYHVRISKFPNSRLITLPESFGELKLLEKLDLSSNSLESIPESFGKLQSLKELNLEDNEIQTLPGGFGNLGALQELRLRGNKLETLPETVGNLKALRKLDLSHNQLRILPESIGTLYSLEELNLEDNKLVNLPESLVKLSNLEQITIVENPLNETAEKILEYISLEGFVDGSQTFFIYEVSLSTPLKDQIHEYISQHQGEGGVFSIPDFIRQAVREKLKESKSIPAKIIQQTNTAKVFLSVSLKDRIYQFIDTHEGEGYSSIPGFIKQAVREKLENLK